MNMHLLHGSLAALALASLSFSLPASAASATFTYSGLPLNTDANGGQPPAPYTGVGSISGQFTLDCTGLGNGDCSSLSSAEYGSRVTDYNFFLSDIGAPISTTFANRNSQPSFFLTSDANRNLTTWSITLTTLAANCPAGAQGCGLRIAGSAPGVQVLPPFDFANLFFVSGSSAAFSTGAGSFQTAPVPLPLPALMLLGGLASMIPLRRRPSSK